MMKKIFTPLFFLLVLSLNILAQDQSVADLKKEANKTIAAPDDTSSKTWKTNAAFNLTIGQGSSSNWSAGAEKFSLAVNTTATLSAYYKKNKSTWQNVLNIAYGVVNTTSQGTRKSNDLIDLYSKYGYQVSKKWYASALLSARTQFANGYKYYKLPSGKDTGALTSKAFSPLYVLLSPGMDYRPNTNFSLFISPITARWVIVGDKTLGTLYGVEAGKTVRSEFGAYLSAVYNKQLNKNMAYTGRLDLFSNYKHNPQNIDVFFTNTLTATISKYINFSVNVNMIYDDDTKNVDPTKGPSLQYLQNIGIGFAYKINNYTAK